MAKKKQQINKNNSNNKTANNFEKNKPNTIMCEAQVVEVLPNAKFKVLLKEFNTVIDATPSGKIRLNHIRILKGDFVSVELSTYDLTKGRITFRYKGKKTTNSNQENN